MKLHILVGNSERLEKRSNMCGGVAHHVEAAKNAENELGKFLDEYPEMQEKVDEAQDYFHKLLYF
jgi:hypothetical protein